MAWAAVPPGRRAGRSAVVAESALRTAAVAAVVRARQLLALALLVCSQHSTAGRRPAAGLARPLAAFECSAAQTRSTRGRWPRPADSVLLDAMAAEVAVRPVRHAVRLRFEAEWDAELAAAASARVVR